MLVGIIHSFVSGIICVYGTLDCKKNTYFTNDYCLHNPSLWFFKDLTLFSAYCVCDLIVLYFFVGKVSNDMLFHHLLGLFGSCAGIFGGGCLTVFAGGGLITEFSTPFVNIRFLLYELDIKTGTLYGANGALMTLSFFIFRIIYQTWLVAYKFFSVVFLEQGCTNF